MEWIYAYKKIRTTTSDDNSFFSFSRVSFDMQECYYRYVSINMNTVNLHVIVPK